MFDLTRRWLRAATLLLSMTTAMAPAVAVEPPPGTKNFAVPSGVPNYFSNEVGAPQGSGGIVRSAPMPGHTVIVPVPSGRTHVAVMVPRRGGRYATINSKGRGAKGRSVATRTRAGGRATAVAGSRSGRSSAHAPARGHVVKAAARAGNSRGNNRRH